MNTRKISGMLLCWEEKANQTQDEKTASCNGNLLCRLRFLISYLIGHRTITMPKSNQSVHGFWIRTVKHAKMRLFVWVRLETFFGCHKRVDVAKDDKRSLWS